MDWTKIKTKHFLFSELSKSLKGDLADLLCLTAHLEQTPTEQQMNKICRKKSINLLQMWFISRSNSLENVLQKVIEDVDKINHKKAISRLTSSTYRNKYANDNTHSDTSCDASCDTIEKRREEKRREEKNLIEKGFNPLWELYPNKIDRSRALKSFLGNCTLENVPDITKALKNYMGHLAEKENEWKKAKNGLTWFNNWRDWVDYQTPPKNQGGADAWEKNNT